MKVLILGGNGFVGRNLAAYLSGFHTVSTASRSTFECNLYFDLCLPSTYTICQDYEVIVNCMVDYSLSVGEALTKELPHKKAFLEYIGQIPAHYIEISSISALPENKYATDYNFIKFLHEEILYYTLKDKSKYSLLRFAQIIDDQGGSRKSQGAYHYFVDAFRNGSTLNVFGNPDVPRSYMPIAVLVQVVQYGIEQKITGTHNVIMPDRYTANGLITAFRQFVEKPLAQIHYDAAKLATEYFIPGCSESFVTLLAGFSCQEVFKKSLLDEPI